MMQKANAPAASAGLVASARSQKAGSGLVGSARVGRKDGMRGTKRGREEVHNLFLLGLWSVDTEVGSHLGRQRQETRTEAQPARGVEGAFGG